MSSKQKGDLLEQIVERLCEDYKKAKVSRNVKVKGKSGVDRQVDVLIQATYKSFDLQIVIEAKNYSTKVDIGIVDAVKTKIADIGGNLGVIVCPLGFTEGAVKAAALHDIQLFQVFDQKLGNTTQFIPLRYVAPYVKSFQLSIAYGASGGGTFEMPTDTKQWRFHVQDTVLDLEELMTYAWNAKMFPQEKEGEFTADFGVQKISTIENLKKFYYLELQLNVIVAADYYLKLFPASFMKNVKSGKGNHQLFIDSYSKKDDMIKNGWKHFETREAMNESAQPHDTSADMHSLIITEDYTLEN